MARESMAIFVLPYSQLKSQDLPPMRKNRLLLILFLPAAILSASDGISGKVYYHLNMPTAAGSYNEFAIKRIYFGYETKIQENIKVKLITDVAMPDSGEGWRLYQKKAYLQYTGPFGDIVLGIQTMNMFNVAQANWGYRFLDKQSMDIHKFAASTDMGIGFLTTLANNLHIHLTITNGGGFKSAETDKHKKYAAQIVYGTKKLGMKNGYNGGIAFSYEPYDHNIMPTAQTITVGSLFGGFATSTFRVGAEYDWKDDSGKGYLATIMAAYGNVKIMDNLHAYTRLELYDPSSTTGSDEETGIIAGLNWLVASNFKVAPNIRYASAPGSDGELTAVMINVEFNY